MSNIIETFTDEDCEVLYEPWTGKNGERGFRCTDRHGRQEYVYIIPSTGNGGAEDGTPCVFLYIGTTGESWNDGPVCYFNVFDEGGWQ